MHHTEVVKNIDIEFLDVYPAALVRVSADMLMATPRVCVVCLASRQRSFGKQTAVSLSRGARGRLTVRWIGTATRSLHRALRGVAIGRVPGGGEP